MNKIIFNTKKVFSLLTLAVIFATGALHAEGGNHDASKKLHEGKTGSASTAEVIYIGNREDQPVFNVLYDNSKGSRFSVSVFDGKGDQLFTSTYSDKHFDKKFTIADGLDIEGKLVFVVRNFSDNSMQSFEINSDTRLIEDVQVKEVK
jgi:hypothetical protein